MTNPRILCKVFLPFSIQDDWGARDGRSTRDPIKYRVLDCEVST